MMFENFYINWFNKELYNFKNKYGFQPSHCIIDSNIYDKMINEFIIKHCIIGLRENNNFNTGELICTGVKIRRGNGSLMFYFYKE